MDALRGIVFPSPAELSRLGVCDEARKLDTLAVLILGSLLFLELLTPTVLPSETRLFSEIVSPDEDEVVGLEGVGGGGCGNAPMLMTFRTDLAGMDDVLPAAEPDLTVGMSEADDMPCGVGSAEGREGALMRLGVTGRLLRGALG